eukprot:4977879-Pyramimonas_sp.AAC.1
MQQVRGGTRRCPSGRCRKAAGGPKTPFSRPSRPALTPTTPPRRFPAIVRANVLGHAGGRSNASRARPEAFGGYLLKSRHGLHTMFRCARAQGVDGDVVP